jgi:protocatechuate 3,4-dioxygenase beta subunit
VSTHVEQSTDQALTFSSLPDAYLTTWACNTTGSYSGFTGISPDTVELLDWYTKNADGTTDEETFLRGIMKTDTEGMAEFLTIFPGYYATRSTHVHLTVQAMLPRAPVTAKRPCSTSASSSSTKLS